jgi:DNA-binding NarL/FixJ family response regulator
MIRVFIVDDSFYVRDSWKILILDDNRTLLWGEAKGADEALDMLEATSEHDRPDVITLDIRFREAGEDQETPKGLGTLKQIIDANLGTRVLCISDCIDPGIVIKAINAGAHGYVDKHMVEEGLVDAIERVHNGSFVVTSNIAEIIIGVISVLHSGGAEIFPDGKRVELTPRKEEIANLFFRYGMSARAVAENLGIATSTVETHIKQIRQILGLTDRDDIVRAITERTWNT